MRIDVHAHYYPEDLIDHMARLGSTFANGARQAPGAGVTLAQRVEMLDGCGIHVQVLCGGAEQPNYADEFMAKDAAHYLNDYYRDVVAKHGGTLDFETEVGKGTTFIIRLPIDGLPPKNA